MVDRLSDRGFLSFTDDLKIIVRKGSHSPSLAELLAEIEGNQAKAATLLPELKNTVIRDQLESNAVDLIRRRICFKRTRLHFLGVSDRSCYFYSNGPTSVCLFKCGQFRKNHFGLQQNACLIDLYKWRGTKTPIGHGRFDGLRCLPILVNRERIASGIS